MKSNSIFRFVFISIFGLILMSSCCDKEPVDEPIVSTGEQTPYSLQIPNGFPTDLNIPEDNPFTVEGIELGRYLFYDGRLSGRTEEDSLMSCSTCHLQSEAFEIGSNNPDFPGGQPVGLTGKPTPHFMLPMINLVFNNEGYLWNGYINNDNEYLGNPSYGVPAEAQYDLKNIESLVWMGIVAEHEMNGSIEKTVDMIQSIEMYPPMFKKAFGSSEVNIDRISKAIAQFIRTLISSDSKFDLMQRGEYQFTDSENRGLVLFTTEEGADCFHCHGSVGNPLFTTHLFYNNAKDATFDGIGDRYSVTKNSMDYGAYKATTLRNIELTGPYMHDGRFTTLEEVIDFYSEGLVYSDYAHPLMEKLNPPYGSGAELTALEKADLKAFLLTLTDETFLTKEEFSNPF